jgi:DNA-directed RNA polymerase I subunit RPA12
MTITSEYSLSKEWMNKLENIVDKLQEKQILVRTKVLYDCEKCKGKESYYFALQLRSADEGQTVFYECVLCG